MATDYKLDIFKVLAEADLRNFNYYNKLTEDERKALGLIVVMRWMSSTTNSNLTDYYIMMVNEVANNGFFDLYEHPELQWKLIAVTGSGKVSRHQWIKQQPNPKGNIKRLLDLLRTKYPLANRNELEMLILTSTEKDVRILCSDWALEDKEIKEIVKGFNDFKKAHQ